MKRKRYSEEQIISILKENEAGVAVRDLVRKYGVSEQSIYRWRAKYGGMDVSDARRLKALEEENRRLKRMVADLSLDKQMLEDVLSKKW
jgi:putative transposase